MRAACQSDSAHYDSSSKKCKISSKPVIKLCKKRGGTLVWPRGSSRSFLKGLAVPFLSSRTHSHDVNQLLLCFCSLCLSLSPITRCPLRSWEYPLPLAYSQSSATPTFGVASRRLGSDPRKRRAHLDSSAEPLPDLPNILARPLHLPRSEFVAKHPIPCACTQTECARSRTAACSRSCTGASRCTVHQCICPHPERSFHLQE